MKRKREDDTTSHDTTSDEDMPLKRPKLVEVADDIQEALDDLESLDGKSPDDPLCKAVSEVVHRDLHHLAHRSWYSMPHDAQAICKDCARWCLEHDRFPAVWRAEAANWVLREGEWKKLPSSSMLERATDVKLLSQLKPMHLRTFDISDSSSSEFVEAVAPAVSHEYLVSKYTKSAHLRAWLKQRPDLVKTLAEKHSGALFRGLYSNSELTQHFGVPWALEHNMLMDETCPELETYFSKERPYQPECKYVNLKCVRSLMLRYPKKINASEFRAMDKLAASGVMSQDETESFVTMCIQTESYVDVRVYARCRADFWRLLSSDLCCSLTPKMLKRMARAGVSLANMQHAAQLAQSLLGDKPDKAPHYNWTLLKLLMDNDEAMNTVVSSGLAVGYTCWELRQLAARVNSKTLLLPALKQYLIWNPLITPLIVSLDIPPKILAKNKCFLMKVAMLHKWYMLSAWLAYKWGWQQSRQPVVKRTLATKEVVLESSDYVECYERCVQLLTSELKTSELKALEQNLGRLEEEDQASIADYAMWCGALEAVELVWSSRVVTPQTVALAIQNPDERVAEFAIKRSAYINAEVVLNELIKARDVKGFLRAFELLACRDLDSNMLKRCTKHASKVELFQVEIYLKTIQLPQPKKVTAISSKPEVN